MQGYRCSGVHLYMHVPDSLLLLPAVSLLCAVPRRIIVPRPTNNSQNGLTCSSHATLDKTKTFCAQQNFGRNEVSSVNGGVTMPTRPGSTGNTYATTPTSAIPNLSGTGRKMML